jgi:hypothetical protein
MGRACARGSRPRTRYIAQLDINPESVSGFSIADASEPWLWIVRARSMSALQKYKVKKIDPFSVTVTNSFLRERVGNKKTPTPTPTKKYENSSSNQ